jgi:crotonobetainyl-CoA:carnitine CoA-transferase CaiB-like acyl-CoA transferase
LCQFVGHEEWMEDPRFSIGTERAKYTDEIYEQLAPWFSERSKDEVFHQAQLWRLPFALVPSAEEIVNMEQHQARGYFVEVEHPVAGTFKYPGAPFKMPLTPFTVSRPAPLLGQHNREVYCELLGLVEADLVRLRQGGVI